MTDTTNPLHKLPTCLQGVPVDKNDYSKFWSTVTAEYREGGSEMGMLFEGYLFRCAKTFVAEYQLGAWDYLHCKRSGKLFYLKPSWSSNVVLANNTLTEKDLDPQAFGFYITLYALNQYRYIAQETHWGNVYTNLLIWAKQKLRSTQIKGVDTDISDEDLKESKRVREALAIIDNITLAKPQHLKSNVA